jgi:hypothetical protein
MAVNKRAEKWWLLSAFTEQGQLHTKEGSQNKIDSLSFDFNACEVHNFKIYSTFKFLEVRNSLEELLKVVLLCLWFFPTQTARFLILTVVNTIFCAVTPWQPTESYQCFRATCCLQLQGKRWKQLLLQKLLTFYHTTWCHISDNCNFYQYSPSMDLWQKHTLSTKNSYYWILSHLEVPWYTVQIRFSLSSMTVLLSHEHESGFRTLLYLGGSHTLSETMQTLNVWLRTLKRMKK